MNHLLSKREPIISNYTSTHPDFFLKSESLYYSKPNHIRWVLKD